MKTPPREDDNVSRRKLIDRLLPGAPYGPLVGLLATTYEFQPEFFETDFLPTLLGLGAWDDRNWTSRVAVEKALSELESAAVFADARRYQGRPRSLRVDVTPIALPAGAALHAKIVLLVHRDCVRLHVASANLTEQGYRRNREVAAPLVVTRGHPEHGALLVSALDGLKAALAPWWTETAERVTAIALDVLGGMPATAGNDDRFLWSAVGTAPMDNLVAIWPKGDQVERITIVSPFWSDERGDKGPLASLTRGLRAGGALGASAVVRLFTEAKNLGDGKYLPVLPESFATFDARPLGVTASAHAVDPSVLPEEVDNHEGILLQRPLHAKVILLEGRDTSVAYLGSANFSDRAWGLLNAGAPHNIEAGLLLRRTGKARVPLTTLVPKTVGPAVELAGAAGGHIVLSSPDEADKPWPSFLRDVRLEPDADNPERLILEIRVEATQIAGPWSLSLLGEDPDATILRVDDTDAGSHRLELPPARLERLLRDQEVRVQWWAPGGDCNVPVNVALAARDALPIVPGSSKPGESLLLAYYQGRISFEELFPDPELMTAHGADNAGAADMSSVDTSRIQSYQVREFVEALRGIRDDLRQAAKSTPRAMKLAVHGAVSPVSLGRAVAAQIESRRRTPTAGAFQFFEILCCLLEARAFESHEQHVAAWRATVDSGVRVVEELLSKLRADYPDLSGNSFARYERTLRTHYRTTSERR